MRNHKAPQDSISPLGSGPSDREVFGWVRARSRRYRRTIVTLFLLSLIGLVPCQGSGRFPRSVVG